MKITPVSICPAPGSELYPQLTPELLAAVAARYSRNNEGLDALMAKVQGMDPDKAVDAIFDMVDYGHQSIADMTPVALFMDGLSIWLVYHLFGLSLTGAGQETSTRYVNMSTGGIINERQLTPVTDVPAFRDFIKFSSDAYSKAAEFWTQLSKDRPELMRIPEGDISEKVVERLRRNFVFDRARCFLPIAATTNVMIVQSARAWVQVIQNLLVHPSMEAYELGVRLENALHVSAPRMARHAVEKVDHRKLLEAELDEISGNAGTLWNAHHIHRDTYGYVNPHYGLEVPAWEDYNDAGWRVRDLEHRVNRYSPIGTSVRMTPVHFKMDAIAFAEARDLNRHRTGQKDAPLMPVGFHAALDQIPKDYDNLEIGRLAVEMAERVEVAKDMLSARNYDYVYFLPLGFQHPFAHVTTADKFIYEVELRTGPGAHYRYAEHMRGWIKLFYKQYPELTGKLLEGQAEPE